MVFRPTTFICILFVTAVLFTCCDAAPCLEQIKKVSEGSITNKVAQTVLLLKNALCPSITRTEIETSPDRYIPLMSSTVGIGLSPEPSANASVIQSWETNFGHFVTWGGKNGIVEKHGRKFSTKGEEPVYWTYDPDTMGSVKPPVKIRLTLYNVKNGNIAGWGKISVRWEDRDTAVVTPLG
jgi:hypothetical protein